MLATTITALLVLANTGFAFPAIWESSVGLAGLSAREVDDAVEMYKRQGGYGGGGYGGPPSGPYVTNHGAQPPPTPPKNTSVYRVNDAAHPYIKPGPNDQRGPCPGLNTLANHGYINRTGVVTPQEIINGVQAGLNMGYDLAVFIGFSGFLLDGNMLTNLVSIGGKTSATGPDTPGPATISGFDTHGTFEGDISYLHPDAYLGVQFDFSQSLFDGPFTSASKQYGNGYYNPTSAAQVRRLRTLDSIAKNPTLDFTSPRYFSGYAESAFAFRMMVDGRLPATQLSLDAAHSFFSTNTYPTKDFNRAPNVPLKTLYNDVLNLHKVYNIGPGKNNGKDVNTYTVDSKDPGVSGGLCGVYTTLIQKVLQPMYPNPQGALKEALRKNIITFYNAFQDVESGCPQLYPYGTGGF